MRSVEVSAKTREEAIEIALLKLKAERHEIAVEVVNEGSAGFLGFGARNWTVRVTVESAGERESYEDDVEFVSEPKPISPENRNRGRSDRNQDRNRRGPRREGDNRGPDRGGNRSQETTHGPAQQAPREGGSRPEPRRDQKPAQPRQEEPRRDRQDRPSQKPAARHQDDPRPERPARQERPAPVARQVSKEIDERDREAAALLQELIMRMGITANVTCKKTDEGATCLSVESEDSAILIGRKGKTLSAMQYLINRIVRRTEEGDDDRMVVDIENYLERRQQALQDLALRMAARAKESGRRVRVKPLSPQERRIIHLTLQDDTEVRTFSVGDSPIRSVVIAPKNERPQSDRPQSDRPQSRGGRGGRHRGGRGRGRGPGPNGGGNYNREAPAEPREATTN